MFNVTRNGIPGLIENFAAEFGNEIEKKAFVDQVIYELEYRRYPLFFEMYAAINSVLTVSRHMGIGRKPKVEVDKEGK
jgi:hypothetical protein